MKKGRFAMMYENVIHDFAERTRKNLRAIETLQRDGKEAYEVTQLVNSMLGLLVFPREEFVGRIPKTPVSELEKSGWPLPKMLGGYPQAKDLQELVRYLRNAFAHFNVEFIPDTSNQICGLKVWNTRPNTGRKTWEAKVTLNELHGIADRFIDLLLKVQRPGPRRPR